MIENNDTYHLTIVLVLKNFCWPWKGPPKNRIWHKCCNIWQYLTKSDTSDKFWHIWQILIITAIKKYFWNPFVYLIEYSLCLHDINTYWNDILLPCDKAAELATIRLLYTTNNCRGKDSQTSEQQDIPKPKEEDGAARLGAKVMATAALFNVCYVRHSICLPLKIAKAFWEKPPFLIHFEQPVGRV